jgi:hypothetical protein
VTLLVYPSAQLMDWFTGDGLIVPGAAGARNVDSDILCKKLSNLI